MIKGGAGPACGVVAGFAGLRKIGRDVIGHAATGCLRTVPVRGVAGIAGRVCGRKIIIVIRVAIGAGRCDMTTG